MRVFVCLRARIGVIALIEGAIFMRGHQNEECNVSTLDIIYARTPHTVRLNERT